MHGSGSIVCLAWTNLLTACSTLQVKELEELCGAQQNSLEEAEEKFRVLQQEHDALHHAALAAKAQLVTAQAQVRCTVNDSCQHVAC